ncbi:hypothetical protein [Halolamina rubra]|uniref:hypothetical protein n=1 Tax=Halolamina rubra TaxID=1380430 RepID=UPI0012AC20DE|nr:hypothetical protein [Halolamina rubra]
MVEYEERVYAEIQFTNEEDTPASELAELLSQLEDLYQTFIRNSGVIQDISPSQMNEEVFYDDTARDTFVGRLHRYGVLGDIRDLQPHYDPQSRVRRYIYLSDEYEGLNIRRIQKESPLLIGLTGSSLFIAVLWVIGGIEYRRKEVVQVDEEGNQEKEITKEFKFDATSTKDLVEEIREFFE